VRPLLGAVTQSAGMLPPISYPRDHWGRAFSILDETGPETTRPAVHLFVHPSLFVIPTC
jgi:hypothetical protein